MRFGFVILFVLIAVFPCIAQPEKSIGQMEKDFVRLNGKGTDPALRKQLLAMGKLDQRVRKPLETMFGKKAKPTEERVSAVNRTIEQTDRNLTQRLEDIFALNGWPTIHLVGAEASSSAAIILVHSPDREFQCRLLPQLEMLVTDHKIMGADIAVLIDKLLIADGKLQRFGTTFNVANGRAVLGPVEDPAHLDELRAEYLLPPMVEFKKSFPKRFT